MDTRFHCVYLLTSLDAQCQGDYYIGYTVNPLRRLRQHNGELVNGARRTSRRGRPWTIVCCVSGFTEDRAALKFEWCWQNPTVSARLKHTVGVLKGLRRLPYAVGTLHLLVRATLFNQLDLTLHIFEPELLHEAQTRAEVFLVMRSGPKSSHTTTSPQRSCGEASQADRLAHPATKCDGGTCASTVDGTQARSAFTAPNITASPTASLLPPLEPSALFHVEELTRQRFEDVYLSHDRCLLLPSDGLACGGGGSFAAERDGEDSCLSASCPYDVSVLSQAARAEWSNASCDDVGDDDYVAEGKGSFSHDENGEAARCVRLVGSHTPSRTPSPGCADTRESPLNMLLGYRSEEEERVEKNIHGDQHSSTSASRSNSAPSRAPLASPTRAPRAGSAATPSAVSSSASRAPSSPALLAAAAEGDATSRQRIPLRFAHFRDTDFANAHADEQYRLHHGLLPCSLCALPLRPPCVVHCSRAPFCELRCHLNCLAMWMLYEEERSNSLKGIAATEYTARGGDDAPHHHQDTSMCLRQLIPSQPCPCPLCGVPLQWGVLIKELKRRTVVEERLQAAQRRARIEQRWQARLAQINGHRAIGERRGTRRKRQRVSCRASATLPTPLSAAKCVTDVSTETAVSPRSDPQTASATQTLAAPRPVPTSINEGEVSLLSSIAAAAPLTDASPLNWTAFCEDDWLL